MVSIKLTAEILKQIENEINFLHFVHHFYELDCLS